jgi:hypothetical protein
MVPQYAFQISQAIKNVNTYTSVEISWFQDPEIFMTMFCLVRLKERFRFFVMPVLKLG